MAPRPPMSASTSRPTFSPVPSCCFSLVPPASSSACEVEAAYSLRAVPTRMVCRSRVSTSARKSFTTSPAATPSCTRDVKEEEKEEEEKGRDDDDGGDDDCEDEAEEMADEVFLAFVF